MTTPSVVVLYHGWPTAIMFGEVDHDNFFMPQSPPPAESATITTLGTPLHSLWGYFANVMKQKKAVRMPSVKKDSKKSTARISSNTVSATWTNIFDNTASAARLNLLVNLHAGGHMDKRLSMPTGRTLRKSDLYGCNPRRATGTRRPTLIVQQPRKVVQ